MSAFVVEDRTINRVIGLLSLDRDMDYLRRQILEELGCDLNSTEGREKLAKAMFGLNCNAVNQRYGENQAQEFRDLDFAYRHERASLIQAYKSLRCWLYQCAEGDVPDTSLLYSTMQRVRADLADTIVGRLPEYEKAQWG